MATPTDIEVVEEVDTGIRRDPEVEMISQQQEITKNKNINLTKDDDLTFEHKAWYGCKFA